MTQKTKTPAKTPPCKHREVHFSDGGYRICCSDCPQEWCGVDESDLPEFELIGSGLYSTDIRRDPFYTPKKKP